MVAIGHGNTMVNEKEHSRKRRRLAWDVAPDTPGNRGIEDEGKVPSRSQYLSPPKRDDNHEGHYVFSLGENLTPRYKILNKMGQGTFGRVLECWDRQTRDFVAIKVIRSIEKYRKAAMAEVDVLHRLSENDTAYSHCVQILDWFDYRNHICIVFEKLGPSLYDVLKRNRYCPLPVDLVQDFARQLLESVTYMHHLRLVHTDLKPENILLVSSESVMLPSFKRSSVDTSVKCLPKSSAIKVIDFGSTVFDDRIHNSIASTRHYRAPEIILGLGWTYPCDLWSVGCILVELCTGESLFQTHDNLEHLAMMERVLGPLPDHMVQQANRGAEKYFKRSRLNWPQGAVSRESIRSVKKLDRLQDLVLRQVESSRSSLSSSLIDLLQGLLKFDPSKRLTAKEALNHPFFRNSAA
ncbi:unnamed protein product [Cuscuta epithymum]|uniref:dual-specificity kinase n=1 Tax=Cuscuta epithymum TaxID=186058 RepID=A0AAV0DTM1_9ASTE|nr:unnamed protein product [Cuscuta epithymum]CAH9126683.1 unnamed protein product [Cuscuta epithymum]